MIQHAQRQAGEASAIDSLDAVLALCAEDMAAVDACVGESLASDVALIRQVATHIISGGGKRLRPMLLVLGARACGYAGRDHVPLAAIIEFIHTATLLHDDVIDQSEVRRGRQSAHTLWGNAASVLVGDFLYSRSFQMMVELDSMRIMRILADTTNAISEGEVQQLLCMGDPEITRETYLAVIEHKTARLFEAACRLGAVVAAESAETEQAMARFGNLLGQAFQVADDVLDYGGDGQAMGKNTGDDLAEGKPTLPLILARARADQAGRELVDRALGGGGRSELVAVKALLERTSALDDAMDFAAGLAGEAAVLLQALPASPWRDALACLARFSTQRDG